MSKTLVQEQFGATARGYLTSKPHAQGKSLDRLVELTRPKPDWQALDVATGAGHTAYTFAPHVARVWATDITEEMLSLVREQVDKRKLANLRVAYAKAEALPFEDETFDLVTCRIAPHHFDSIPRFLGEARQLLPADVAVTIELPDSAGTPVPDLGLSSRSFEVGEIRRDFPILQERVNGRPLIWLDNAATTQKPQSVIDRLERAGLVKRERDAADRRKVMVHPTACVEKTIPPLFEPLHREMTAMWTSYSDDQLELILDFLTKVRDVMRAEGITLRNAQHRDTRAQATAPQIKKERRRDRAA